MKKKIKWMLTAVSVMLCLSGCGNSSDDIGSDRAEEIAMEDAGVSEDEVSRLRTSSDRDDGRTIYEVQFATVEAEYEYEIDASDGTIRSSDVEYTSAVQNAGTSGSGDSGSSGNAETADQGSSTQGQQSSGQTELSMEEAKKLVLDKVSGAADSDLRIELDQEDGRWVYEGDVIYNRTEYEFEIDANTGEFLKWSEEK